MINIKLSAILQSLFFFFLGLVILYFVVKSSGLDIRQNLRDFQSMHPGWLIAVCVVFMISNLHRTWRWQMLLEPLGYKTRFVNGYLSVVVGYFINLFITRTGEVARAASLAKYEKISFDKTMGTIVVDRLIDLITVMVIIVIGVVWQWRTFGENLGRFDLISKAKVLLFLGPLALGGLILLYVFFKRNRENKYIQRINGVFNGFKSGLKSIVFIKNKPLFIFHSIAIWVCYFLMTYLMVKGFESTQHLGVGPILIVFIFGNLGMIFPSPGGIGSFQAAFTFGLMIYGINKVGASSLSNILFFVIQFFCNVIFGVLAFFLLPMLNSTKSDKPTDQMKESV